MAKDPQHGKGTKRGIRAFLTPGWILSLVLVVLFTYFAFTTLAPWQLGKNTKRSEFNDRLKAAMEQDPVPASDILPADPKKPVDEANEWRHVRLQGTMQPQHEVLLRNRPVESAPAYQVLTPFETTDGLTVLVNRGWVPAEGDNRPKEITQAPAGEMELTGYVRLGEDKAERGVIEAEGRQQTTAINAAQIGEATGVELSHDYVQLDEESTQAVADRSGEEGNAPVAIPLPKIESGPYLSYGIQWIVFGIVAPILLGWFIWSEIKERRREQEEREQMASGAPAAGSVALVDSGSDELAGSGAEGVLDDEENGGTSGDGAAGQEQAATQEDVMAARYGKAAKRRGFGWRNDEGGERF